MANAGVDTGANTRCRGGVRHEAHSTTDPAAGAAVTRISYVDTLRRSPASHRLRYSLGVIPVTRRNVVVK